MWPGKETYMKIKPILLMAFCFAVVQGCAHRDKPPELSYISPTFSQDVYHIGIGDKLEVVVWENESLSISEPVRPDGKIAVPLIGDVQAAGVEPEKLAELISLQLAEHVEAPSVIVVVADPVSAEFLHRVRITGQVEEPMSIPYRKRMTVMDLVLIAGGVSVFGAADSTRLYRVSKDGIQVYPVYLDDILNKGDLSTNYTLLPNDIIIVPERVF